MTTDTELLSVRSRYDANPGTIIITKVRDGEHLFEWKGGDIVAISDELMPEIAMLARDGLLPWCMEFGPRDPERGVVYAERGGERPL